MRITFQQCAERLLARSGRSLAVLSVFAVSSIASIAFAQTPFYQASPHELAGAPGTVIRSEPIAFAPAGAQAWRILYRSTGLDGQPIAVSGVAVIPAGEPPAN